MEDLVILYIDSHQEDFERFQGAIAPYLSRFPARVEWRDSLGEALALIFERANQLIMVCLDPTERTLGGLPLQEAMKAIGPYIGDHCELVLMPAPDDMQWVERGLRRKEDIQRIQPKGTDLDIGKLTEILKLTYARRSGGAELYTSTMAIAQRVAAVEQRVAAAIHVSEKQIDDLETKLERILNTLYRPNEHTGDPSLVDILLSTKRLIGSHEKEFDIIEQQRRDASAQVERLEAHLVSCLSTLEQSVVELGTRLESIQPQIETVRQAQSAIGSSSKILGILKGVARRLARNWPVVAALLGGGSGAAFIKLLIELLQEE